MDAEQIRNLETGDTPEAPSVALVRAVSAWVEQLSRTVKTCRLYDRQNSAAEMLRDELGRALARLLDTHGSFTLQFSDTAIRMRNEVLHRGHSRDDNLAYVFHRDGIRAISFHPGVSGPEVEGLVNALVQVMTRNPLSAEAEQEDLVTLLWKTSLAHMTIEEAPAEGDIETGLAEAEAKLDDGAVAPWPAGDADAPATEASAGAAPQPAGAPGRSDDWMAEGAAGAAEGIFRELENYAPTWLEEFRALRRAEVEEPVLAASLAFIRDCLAADTTEEDRHEIAQYLPRVLRESLGEGDWVAARQTLLLLGAADRPGWSLEGFVHELRQPASVVTPRVLKRLDDGQATQLEEFAACAREFGPAATDWLLQLLGEIDHRRVRQMLVHLVADLCRAQPERLAPWLADERWFVVRNAVHILGLVGGPEIVGMLGTVANHPEYRVRREVAIALGHVDVKAARPVLRRLLDRSEPRLRLAALESLAHERDAALARDVLGEIRADGFENRPEEERQGLYAVLGRLADDSVLPEFEVELREEGWFAPNRLAHRLAIARAVAAVGTPAARATLTRGTSSRSAAVRKACETALAEMPS